LLTLPAGSQSGGENSYVNSIGVRMVKIPAGSFRMGNDRPTPPALLGQFELLENGDYDEKPVHEVRISRDFYISEMEITAEQFARFRFDHADTGRFSPSASGVTWHDAVKFTEWLSRKEKKNYRLPTEAEWEYAARAATAGHFATGDRLPADGEANAWGVKNMHTGVAEWVLDWHGIYPPEPQTDPVGPASGWSRVVRGGGIMGATRGEWKTDLALPFYRRSANRASAPPEYRGHHNIGFRIVEAPMPQTPHWESDPKFPQQFVKQTAQYAKEGPDPKRPWFRTRPLVPIPPENAPEKAILAAGVDPSVLGHLHSGGVAVCPNGDLIAAWFTSSTPATEYEPNATIAFTRLRYGSEQWDMPEGYYDFADVNDQTSLLWNDRGKLWHFTGGFGLTHVPFRVQTSLDSGATWEPPRLPVLLEPLGGYWPQPVNTAFRDAQGAIYIPSDGVGGESMLWSSADDGKTWFDTGGRTAGRHTVFAPLKDGGILGIGGKNTDIDGYMPQAISRDGGKTWTVSKTRFPALGSNQRPSLLRLASGRLFFASDWQERRGKKPAGITERGAFVALSDDEGKTWKTKTLPNALPHEMAVLPPTRSKDWLQKYHSEGTLGYSVATQAPNGVIHLLSSMNHPSLHWEINEAWILSPSSGATKVEEGGGLPVSGRERYADGKAKGTWSGQMDMAGRFVLDGAETWFFPSGKKQYEVTWRRGFKTGAEILWREDGSKVWEWEHRADGTKTWTQYWRGGKMKSRSNWRGGKAEGTAVLWDFMGREIARHEFKDGELIR
jgi:formylglycine-generating enzyme required for sulfatase activity